VALSEIDQNKLRETGKANGIDRLYIDYRNLLESENPDFLSICTPAPQHREITVASAASGIHVLCEKPIATDLAEADEMISACDQAGVKLAINHQQRCSPQFQNAKRLVTEGRIGHLRVIHDRGKNRQGGYEMMEIGTHIFDSMHFFADDPLSAFGHLTTRGYSTTPEDIASSLEVDPNYRDIGLVAGDNIVAHFCFKNDVFGLAEFYRSPGPITHGKQSRLLYGTDGILAIKPGGDMGTNVLFYPEPIYDPTSSLSWEPMPMPKEEMIMHGRFWPSTHIIRPIDEMVRCLDEDRDHASNGRAGRNSMEMIQGVYASHFSGRRVDLPLADRQSSLQTIRAGLS
jgi:predicted dehydrogenase